MKLFGAQYRRFYFICLFIYSLTNFWTKSISDNHIILGEGENRVVDICEIPEIFNVYFSNIASEISF